MTTRTPARITAPTAVPPARAAPAGTTRRARRRRVLTKRSKRVSIPTDVYRREHSRVEASVPPFAPFEQRFATVGTYPAAKTIQTMDGRWAVRPGAAGEPFGENRF